MYNKLKINLYFVPLFILCIFSFVFIVSCKDSGVSSSSDSPPASVSLMADDAATDASGNVITLDSAKFIIEMLQLHRADESSTMKLGPFRVFITLSNRVTLLSVANVPIGEYDKVSFKIHKHNPNDQLPDNDPDFLNQNGPVGYSGVIAGTYNGEHFVYKSSKTAHQFVTIAPPLTVVPGTMTVNVTVLVMWREWFTKNGEILDPQARENWNDIENNIKDSFNKAFRDNDRDGIPDR